MNELVTLKVSNIGYYISLTDKKSHVSFPKEYLELLSFCALKISLYLFILLYIYVYMMLIDMYIVHKAHK